MGYWVDYHFREKIIVIFQKQLSGFLRNGTKPTFVTIFLSEQIGNQAVKVGFPSF